MSCCCNNAQYGLPCCCPIVVGTTTTTTTTTCVGAESCDASYSTDCIIYNGISAECYGIYSGMKTTDVITILIDLLPQCTTTTTTTTTSTTTTTTTICPCTTFEFVGSDSSLNVFDYVPCGETLYTSISPSATLEYACVNLAYPVLRSLGSEGSFTNTEICCPTTTTTTTTIP